MEYIVLQYLPIIFVILLVILFKKGMKQDKEYRRNEYKGIYRNKTKTIDFTEKILQYFHIRSLGLLLVIAITLGLSDFLEKFYYEIIERELPTIWTIVIGGLAVFFAILFALRNEKRENYIIFEFKSTKGIKKLQRWIGWYVAYTVAFLILSLFVVIDKSFVQWCVSSIILISFSGICIIIRVMIILISGEDFEVSTLKTLQENYWKKKLFIVPQAIWNRSALNINLAYLIEKYQRCVEALHKDKIKKIEFLNITTSEKEGVQIGKQAIIKLIGMFLFLLIFFYYIIWINGKNINLFSLVINIALIISILVLRRNNKFMKKYYPIINRMALQQWGYYLIIETENGKEKNYFVASFLNQSSKNYKDYFVWLRNLICFANMSLMVEYRKRKGCDKDAISEIISSLVAFYNDNDYLEKRRCSTVLQCVPLILIGYIDFDDFGRANEELANYIKKRKNFTNYDKKILKDFAINVCLDLYGGNGIGRFNTLNFIKYFEMIIPTKKESKGVIQKG